MNGATSVSGVSGVAGAPSATARRRRVLFFAEPATLAHVARPVVLARALDARRHEVAIATGPDYRRIATDAGLAVRDLHCIGTRAYLAAVAAGRPVFPYRTLEAYVADDLRHIEAFRPDLVVGDMRLSLAVSARLAKVPYVAISNAYWSPYAAARIDVPEHAMTRLIGPGIAGLAFRPVAPLVLALHALPMHRLRRRHGLPSLGLDLRRVFTEGDVTVLADVPQMVPTAPDPVGGERRWRYVGPVVWSPDAPLPEALRSMQAEAGAAGRPLAYLGLGSSGDPRLLADVIAGLDAAGCRIALATAGRPAPLGLPADAIVSDFLPGDRVAALARLVVTNGGSPGTHQALGAGTPVLGVPANLDQLLNMQFAVATGAALSLRPEHVTVRAVRDAARRLVGEPSFARAARRVAADWFSGYDAGQRFGELVDELLG